MTSKEFGWLKQVLADLKDDLIIEGKDYDKYNRQDHRMALSFRLLASAAVEQYVEDRCKSAASASMSRLSKRQKTRAGHALVLWYVIKRDKGVIPLNVDEISHASDFLSATEEAYKNLVKKTHGMDDKDLRSLVIPLGLPEADIDEFLCTMLKDLGLQRNRAAHHLVNRAKSMTEPVQEWRTVQTVLNLLENLDEAIERAVMEL
ncbi:HEPN domain-containing protein [Nonomuraea fuscirosea]|uniref:HEPN domain-containing protein n=1 Tax=Nonomuraea fuscirosea TaxID=1291556 RepID=UPI00371F3DFF